MPTFLPLLRDLAGPSPAGVAPKPDMHVYQPTSSTSLAKLKGATTSMQGGTMLDVFAHLAHQDYYDSGMPTNVSNTLRQGPAIAVPIGSVIDVALAGFPNLMQLMAAYKTGGALSPIEGSPVALPATSGVVVSGAAEYLGYTVRETSGTAVARIILRDSVTAGTGAFLEEITLSAGQSASDEYDRPGRLVSVGIYATIVGAIEGSVFT